jgi:hypothetical protein
VSAEPRRRAIVVWKKQDGPAAADVEPTPEKNPVPSTGPETEDEGVMRMANVEISREAQRRVGLAIDLLRPCEDEPQVGALIMKLSAIADPGRAGIERLEKAAEERELVRKREEAYLARVSPAGYERWRAAHERAGLA